MPHPVHHISTVLALHAHLRRIPHGDLAGILTHTMHCFGGLARVLLCHAFRGRHHSARRSFSRPVVTANMNDCVQSAVRTAALWTNHGFFSAAFLLPVSLLSIAAALHVCESLRPRNALNRLALGHQPVFCRPLLHLIFAACISYELTRKFEASLAERRHRCEGREGTQLSSRLAECGPRKERQQQINQPTAA